MVATSSPTATGRRTCRTPTPGREVRGDRAGVHRLPHPQRSWPRASGFDGRSDYDAFAQAGIATGGVDSGADKVKTPEQATRWGGTAGEIFDQNYHTARDTFANVNQKVLGTMAPAVAYAAGYFAML